MRHAFDPGYVDEPFTSLCESYPEASIYPARDFRVEWGPIFHRGRLDGSARVLVLGQDPGVTEAVVRRILVGAAGHRVQGFLAKLGIESSYVMVNAFLYSVYGQRSANRHKDDPLIVEYRNRWLDALLVGKQVEAVLAFGALARDAFLKWQLTPAGQGVSVAFARATHPTQPEGASHGDAELAASLTKAMLANWNRALQRLAPKIHHPDVERELVHYGEALTPGDLAPIPERDFPAGLPAWMHSPEPWASRSGETPFLKRATIVVTVPEAERTWPP